MSKKESLDWTKREYSIFLYDVVYEIGQYTKGDRELARVYVTEDQFDFMVTQYLKEVRVGDTCVSAHFEDGKIHREFKTTDKMTRSIMKNYGKDKIRVYNPWGIVSHLIIKRG